MGEAVEQRHSDKMKMPRHVRLHHAEALLPDDSKEILQRVEAGRREKVKPRLPLEDEHELAYHGALPREPQ